MLKWDLKKNYYCWGESWKSMRVPGGGGGRWKSVEIKGEQGARGCINIFKPGILLIFCAPFQQSATGEKNETETFNSDELLSFSLL